MLEKQESPVLRARSLDLDLLTCYRELLRGVPISELCERYAKVDMLAAQELRGKYVALEELKAFQDRRTRQLKTKTGQVLECKCGLMCFDLLELERHLGSLADHKGHGLRGSR